MGISDTEKLNENTVNIDVSPTIDVVKMINNEDFNAVRAVENCLPEIAAAVDIISENFKNGGRLIYFGAGTSGRLGVLDASECPPTYSVSEKMVVGVIAGGDYALRHAVEGAEDKPELAKEDFEKLNITENDTVTAISASGNAAYVVEVLKLAKEMLHASEEGNKLGLTDEELAFYDALTKPEAVKDFYSNEYLVALTKELTETLRKNKTIDWQKKESARAKMRMIVKKLLKKYKYPPEGQEDALKTVISQCELWTDNVADFDEAYKTVSYSINDDYGMLKAAEPNPDYGK